MKLLNMNVNFDTLPRDPEYFVKGIDCCISLGNQVFPHVPNLVSFLESRALPGCRYEREFVKISTGTDKSKLGKQGWSFAQYRGNTNLNFSKDNIDFTMYGEDKDCNLVFVHIDNDYFYFIGGYRDLCRIRGLSLGIMPDGTMYGLYKVPNKVTMAMYNHLYSMNTGKEIQMPQYIANWDSPESAKYRSTDNIQRYKVNANKWFK